MAGRSALDLRRALDDQATRFGRAGGLDALAARPAIVGESIALPPSLVEALHALAREAELLLERDFGPAWGALRADAADQIVAAFEARVGKRRESGDPDVQPASYRSVASGGRVDVGAYGNVARADLELRMMALRLEKVNAEVGRWWDGVATVQPVRQRLVELGASSSSTDLIRTVGLRFGEARAAVGPLRERLIAAHDALARITPAIAAETRVRGAQMLEPSSEIVLPTFTQFLRRLGGR